MARTADSRNQELEIAHAALTFIEAKGLTREFYQTFGQHCTEKCLHEEWPGFAPVRREQP